MQSYQNRLLIGLHYYQELRRKIRTHTLVLKAKPEHGDFLVDGKYVFEIGGKNKNFSQIRDIKKSFLALDNIEIGIGNKIPLWVFGFLY